MNHAHRPISVLNTIISVRRSTSVNLFIQVMLVRVGQRFLQGHFWQALDEVVGRGEGSGLQDDGRCKATWELKRLWFRPPQLPRRADRL